jgi:LPXTG-motif cell wall-anchored protein
MTTDAASTGEAAPTTAGPGPDDYQFQLNKHDEKDKRVVYAVLTIESVNKDIDLSGVKVLQNGKTAENFKLSSNKKKISFTTISKDDAYVYGLPQGKYYITESIVPEGYVKADRITVTITKAGSLGGVYVKGTPQEVFNREVLMLDKADPSAKQPYVPATGEDATLAISLAVICFVVSGGVAIFALRRSKKETEN